MHLNRIAALAAAVIASTASLAAAEVVFVDFGTGDTPTNFNEVTVQDSFLDAGGSGGPVTVTNLIDETGTATAIDLVADGFNGENNRSTFTPTGDAAKFGLALNDSLYGNVGTFGGGSAPNPTVLFSDLDPTSTYDFEFSASRAGVTDVRSGLYTFTGANSGSTVFDASSNESRTGVVNGIIPDANGEILLSMTVADSNNNGTTRFFYLGALRLEGTPGEVVPEPATAGVFGLAAAGLLLRRRKA